MLDITENKNAFKVQLPLPDKSGVATINRALRFFRACPDKLLKSIIASLQKKSYLSFANALTGNVPAPLNFGGRALKVKPSSGTCCRLHRCSTISTSAWSRRE